MKLQTVTSLMLSTCLLIGCGQTVLNEKTELKESSVEAGSTIVLANADIVTVAKEKPSAQAVAIRDGKILAVGSRQEVIAVAGDGAIVRDMKGRTIVPGLIDAHGHISITATSQAFANVQPPPAGPATSIAQLQEILKAWEQANPESPWIMGWGYDDSLLAEGRHPNRHDLDKISAEKPVMLTHVSGHLLSCNTKCLELSGYTAETPDPAGGVIQREGSSKQPNGVLEESAIYRVFFSMPVANADNQGLLARAQNHYASYGITTVQDGAAQPNQIVALQKMAAADKLFLDVVAYRAMNKGEEIPADYMPSRDYDKHFRIGGIKLILDGSPQGKTAWMTQPYFHPPHGLKADYKGYPRHDDDEVNQFVEAAFAREIPVLAHANGDAAADQLIDAVAAANQSLGNGDRRTVMIHAQTVREDQLDKMAEENIVPSFFVAHTFFWGDWHRDSVFGDPRASRISPLKSTVQRDMPYTTHNDSPIVPPDMMRLMWAAVNRVTRSGKTLGADQRVSPLEALKSITINAAYQAFEEDSKGSIEAGKLADFTVLSANPLTVDAMAIKDITIEETIKNGESVYQREN